jgi:hypothetical protein
MYAHSVAKQIVVNKIADLGSDCSRSTSTSILLAWALGWVTPTSLGLNFLLYKNTIINVVSIS